MNRTSKIGAIFLVLALTTFGINSVYADTLPVQLSQDQMILVIIIGAIGGLYMAWNGYRTAPENETFSILKFLDGVFKSALVSVPLAITASLSQTEMNIFAYVAIFGASVGYTWIISNAQKKTIP